MRSFLKKMSFRMSSGYNWNDDYEPQDNLIDETDINQVSASLRQKRNNRQETKKRIEHVKRRYFH